MLPMARRLLPEVDMNITEHISEEIERVATRVLRDLPWRDPARRPLVECTCPEFCLMDHGN
jgi:hypothetical protein